jgi:two-component system response regulator FixJ
MAGIVAGKANKMIARELDLSVRTVENYRASLMSKMKVKSIAELVSMATRHNTVEPRSQEAKHK